MKVLHIVGVLFGALLMCCGVLGLIESSKWAAVQSDRPTNFVLGAIFIAARILALEGLLMGSYNFKSQFVPAILADQKRGI
jgi:hypothetical protein